MSSSKFIMQKLNKKEIIKNTFHPGSLLLEKDLALSPMILDDKIINDQSLFSDLSAIPPKSKDYNPNMFMFSTLSDTNEITKLLIINPPHARVRIQAK